jgi:hypothetical protein
MAAQAQAASSRPAKRISSGTKPFLARVLLRPALHFPRPGQADTHLVVHDGTGASIAVYIHGTPDASGVSAAVSSHLTLCLARLTIAVPRIVHSYRTRLTVPQSGTLLQSACEARWDVGTQ